MGKRGKRYGLLGTISAGKGSEGSAMTEVISAEGEEAADRESEGKRGEKTIIGITTRFCDVVNSGILHT